MKYTNFYDYLQSKFMEYEPGFVDDDLPDACESWIENRDVYDIIEWADDYTKIKVTEKELEIWKEAKDIIMNMPYVEEGHK